jgi:hypothetical protein
MTFSEWDVPVKADSYRSIDLKKFKFDRNALVLELIEEETEKVWNLSFDSLQAFKTTTEECSAEILEELPVGSGFFKSSESAWLNSLGKGDVAFLNDACHFIICCYDEVIEIIADSDSPQFLKGS